MSPNLLKVHCEWGKWSKMDECSKTCGTGTRTNSRSKSVEEANGGTCSGQYTETEECKMMECPGTCHFPNLLLQNKYRI